LRNSVDRVLTTHVGSFMRSPEILSLAIKKADGADYDDIQFLRLTRDAVQKIMQRQIEYGLDIINDGEQAKSNFAGYISERLTGFYTANEPSTYQGPWQNSRDELDFPDYYGHLRATMPIYYSGEITCVGPVAYVGQSALQVDIENIRAASQSLPTHEVFMTAISTTNVEGRRRNEFYSTEDEYLQAIADAMHEEYAAIVNAGLILQVDDPRLSTYYINNPGLTVKECRNWAEKRVEVLNYALRGIPEDRIRFHTCYSIDIGPRVHDMMLKDLVDIMLKVNAGGYSFEAANPRHEHEYELWREVKLPDGKVLLPGVVSHTTTLVEHPELVAQRILRFANIVGRENVIASADCGFASTTREVPDIFPSVAWAKLAALVEGAQLATRTLWKG
jgi:5-methyltetrahydropteroyltriglutamate--homocysteine methyltransferase